MATMPLVPGARSHLLNGLMQSDLDANNFKIWNLDTSNLGNTGAPNAFPPEPSIWLNSYDPVSRNFTGTQPATTNLSDFPPIAGHAGQFLTNDGISALSWGTPQGGGGGGPGGFTGYLNVKQAPYNAKGDGVTDDFGAINQAITDSIAGGGGLTVYFPYGNYYCSQNFAPTAPVSLLGDNPYTSIIKGNHSVAGPVFTLPAASAIRNLGINADMLTAATAPAQKTGIYVQNANAVVIDNCLVANCTQIGIFINTSFSTVIRNCTVFNCGLEGIALFYAPRCLIQGNQVGQTSADGITLVNSQNCTVANNQVYQCGTFGYGISLYDSDNSTIMGNLAQQCMVGIVMSISSTRALSGADLLQSYGMTCVGNNVCRNYQGGVQFIYAHGFQLTGNTITDNGQGGTDNATYTIEPGLMVGTTGQGSGYAVGDILTVIGGTGTAAKALVTIVTPAGAVYPDGLFLLSPGNYSVFPADPVSFSGGSGTGLKAVFTGSQIAAAGTGYKIGQVLRATNGTCWQPVRVMVTGVGGNGAVTKYIVTDGGGYTGTLPATLTFAGDANSPMGGPISGPGGGSGGSPVGPDNPDLPDSGSGFTLLPNFGLRYSSINNGGTSFGLNTYHSIGGGVVSGNILDRCKTGPAYLNLGKTGDPPSNPLDRAMYLSFTGNQVIHNLYSFKGQSVGGPLDDNYNPGSHSIFANNVVV